MWHACTFLCVVLCIRKGVGNQVCLEGAFGLAKRVLSPGGPHFLCRISPATLFSPTAVMLRILHVEQISTYPCVLHWLTAALLDSCQYARHQCQSQVHCYTHSHTSALLINTCYKHLPCRCLLRFQWDPASHRHTVTVYHHRQGSPS